MSAQGLCFHKLTADVSSGSLEKVWWEGPCFHKLMIVQTLFTKRMAFIKISCHGSFGLNFFQFYSDCLCPCCERRWWRPPKGVFHLPYLFRLLQTDTESHQSVMWVLCVALDHYWSFVYLSKEIRGTFCFVCTLGILALLIYLCGVVSKKGFQGTCPVERNGNWISLNVFLYFNSMVCKRLPKKLPMGKKS